MEVVSTSEPRTATIGDVVVRLVKEDITELPVDGFVFYAQPDLALGSGFGGMIAVRGGASIQKELAEMAPVPAMEAVVSGAGKLPAEYIIHAVGPRFREDDTEPKLLATMEHCLQRAEEKGMQTLALPAMGAGYYGIPAPTSAKVMLSALQNHLAGDTALKEVTICVLDTPQFQAFDAALAALP